ncbi:MAG: peptidylprolyl isomerase, partial [Lutibacter sp.]
AKNELDKVRQDILSGKISFEDAVKKYSEDKETKNNEGLILNPQSNDTHFDLTRMDPTLYDRISDLNSGEITKPFYDEIRGGAKMFKIILVKSKTKAHTANFDKDYEKIQQLALEKKKEEAIDKWAKEKIADTYIKINKDFKKCTFSKNWKKQ